ncbi:MurR/RpiR family transcriptional regulator [Desemzia sp. RIT804]|uniref:MurR/RpiR family transcriptional regulator n=1 Tax=Desemzia sp. RIT 804 TaxID=2810209 RepID=UPI001952560C|nr:MurR/RpiR family transcriptional regulator [Desemzia sp. RIT 804]MBM6615305.1 MurR/RpiR family transcriptional regulator [Desemzia sp. RIT 804]
MYKVIHQLKERNFDTPVTKSELAVLDYLEENFRKIPEITVVKIAQESYTSQATVNRTCKLLGFNGFSELKYAISEDIQRMHDGTTMHIQNTEYILSKINFKSASSLVYHIYHHRNRLLLFGLGGSNVSAQYMARQLLYLGIPVIVVSELQMLKKFEGYSILILSNTGETQRCLQIMNDARKVNMNILAITKKDSSVMNGSLHTFHHDVPVDKMEGISREQQLQMILMINEVINQLKNQYFPRD